jgi:CRP-like cAMP-binding protein
MIQDSNEILERIRNIDLFNDFINDEERLLNIARNTKKEIFKEGQIIIKEGDVGDKLYILHSGTIRIIKSTTVYQEKYTVNIMSAENNIFFGEIALIDSETRSATVLAENDCTVFSIHRKNFIDMCENDPLFGYKVLLKIAKNISASLRKMNKDVVTLFEALVSEVEGD